jgi:hypothetical protein
MLDDYAAKRGGVGGGAAWQPRQEPDLETEVGLYTAPGESLGRTGGEPLRAGVGWSAGPMRNNAGRTTKDLGSGRGPGHTAEPSGLGGSRRRRGPEAASRLSARLPGAHFPRPHSYQSDGAVTAPTPQVRISGTYLKCLDP